MKTCTPFLKGYNGILRPQKIISSLYFYIQSSIREAKRRKLYYLLALISTLIVVTATAVSLSVTEYTPLIFLKAAESSNGIIDVSLTPVTASFSANDGVTLTKFKTRLLLNTTRVTELLGPGISSSMVSRYTLWGSAKLLDSSKNCNGNSTPPYVRCKSYSTTVVLQNTEQEAKLDLGSGVELPSEIPYAGVIITRKLARILKVVKGETIILQLDATELFQFSVVQFNMKQPLKKDRIDDTEFWGSTVYLPFKIEDIVGDFGGKFNSDSSDTVMIIEQNNFIPYLLENFPNVTAKSHKSFPAFVSFLRTEPIQNYADIIIFNFPNRQDIYMNSNSEKIQQEVIKMSTEITSALGVFPYYLNLPLSDSISTHKYIQLFLGIILNLIIAVVFILSTILIYNLLMVTLETKTFEFGVIRMIGLSKPGLAKLILIQALSFVIPGIILGIGVSIPLLMYAGNILESKIQVNIPIVPTGKALFWSIILGLIIPIISSYYPMKEALGKDLNLALDLVHSKTNSIQISVEINSKKIPWPSITFGLLSAVFGFAIYILLPLSLLSLNVGLLLGMFFAILIGLLVGLSLLSLNLQHIMERIITTVFFFWTNKSYRSLITKNLTAHKLRNRQTSIMYSLSLGFVIFLMVALDQQLKTMTIQTQAEKGALFEITTSSENLNQTVLETFIRTNLSETIESYAWITKDLVSFAKLNDYYDVILTNKGKLYSVTPSIKGVSPTIFKTTENDYLKINNQDENTELDLGEQLYTTRGSQGVILGEAYMDQLGLSLDIESSIIIQLQKGINSTIEELRVLASLGSAPGFKVSPLPSVTTQDVLISLPTYKRLIKNITGTVDKIPLEKLLIKVKGNTNENLGIVSEAFNQLKQANYSSLQIWDATDAESSLKSNQDSLSFIFMSVQAITMILSLFSLVTSMSTNIMEQTKEIAVLRAIGMTKIKVNLLFVCEAFVLVISSALFGIFIGTLVAWTLALQQILFTQLPFIFSFPFKSLSVIFIGAVVSAFASSYLPVHRITRLQISKIIRLGG